MSRIERRLAALGYSLPGPPVLPEGMILPFAWVNVRGDRAFVAGHGPQLLDGSPAGPFGAVGIVTTVEEAQQSAGK